VDPGDTAAAAYLATVPGIDDPAAAARRCLVAGLRAHCAVAATAAAARAERPADRAALDRLVDARLAEGPGAFGPAGGDGRLGRDVLRAVAAATAGTDGVDPTVPLEALAVSEGP